MERLKQKNTSAGNHAPVHKLALAHKLYHLHKDAALKLLDAFCVIILACFEVERAK
jgi:hypothetical protein